MQNQNSSAAVRSLRRWPRLAVGILALFFCGVLYAWSIVKSPLESEVGFTRQQLAVNFTITMIFFCLGGLASGLLQRRVRPRVLLLASAVLYFGGMLGCSLLGAPNTLLLYLFYGVMQGLAIGISYNVIISVTGSWFQDKKGLCNGALMMAFGASSLLLGNLLGWLFEQGLITWSRIYFALGLLVALVLIFTALFMDRPSPEQAALLPQPKVRVGGAVRSYSTGEMLRDKTFWIFFVAMVCQSAVGNAMLGFVRDISLSVGFIAVVANFTVGLIAVANGLGRIFFGLAFDRLKESQTMFLAQGTSITGSLFCLGGVLIHPSLLFVGLAFIGLSYGAGPTLSAAYVQEHYGFQHFALNFSVATTTLIPASFAGTIAVGLPGASESFTTPLLFLLGIGLAGFGFVALLMALAKNRVNITQ